MENMRVRFQKHAQCSGPKPVLEHKSTGQGLGAFHYGGPASRTGLTHIRFSDIFYLNEETICKKKGGAGGSKCF